MIRSFQSCIDAISLRGMKPIGQPLELGWITLESTLFDVDLGL